VVTPASAPRSEPIAVADEILAEMRQRLRSTRWPDDPDNDDGRYGVPRILLEELVAYWADGFDWRAVEREINRYEHFKVDIDGVPVHFMRRTSARSGATPIILSHGWPWTFWHWSKVIDRLADPVSFGGDPEDSFDVIVPSLPGFGYSTPTSPTMNFSVMADVFHKLMTEVLGHERYAAAGCDLGAFVTAQLGHKYADKVSAIHIGGGRKLDLFNGDRAWDVTGGQPLPADMPEDARAQLVDFEQRFAVHLAANILEPATLSYALSDSPAGMLAWILKGHMKWSDNGGDVFTVFSRDELLTHATIFWTGNTIGSSMRSYATSNRYPWTPSHDRKPVVEAPTGITFVARENPPGVTTPEERNAWFLASDRADWFNLVDLSTHAKGGHFVPWEIPAEWTADVVRTMRPYRSEGPVRTDP